MIKHDVFQDGLETVVFTQPVDSPIITQWVEDDDNMWWSVGWDSIELNRDFVDETNFAFHVWVGKGVEPSESPRRYLIPKNWIIV